MKDLKEKKYKIIINAGSLFSGGTLSIARDLINEFCENNRFDVFVVVHKKILYSNPSCRYIEIPWIKNSWLHRIFFETIYINYLIKKFNINSLFCSHDFSSYVFDKKVKQYVYCHNPSMFARPTLTDLRFNYKHFIFCFIYKYIYRFNIHSNKLIFVQQRFIKNYFQSEFKCNNVLITRPRIHTFKKSKSSRVQFEDNLNFSFNHSDFYFIYPTLSRTFKNIEFIISVFKSLNFKYKNKYNLILTLENSSRYDKYLSKFYKDTSNIYNAGFVSQPILFNLMKLSDCLVFPSLLETWGLPLTEASSIGLPIICSDKHFCHETLQDYANVSYLNPHSHNLWVNSIASINSKPIVYSHYTNSCLLDDINVVEAVCDTLSS
jgi:glycosyltransferase involved in cell wall biosynthesis